MNKVKKQMTIYTAICTAILMILSGCCISRTSEDAVVIFVIGNVKIQRGMDEHKAELRELLKDGDIVSTGRNSSIAVQVGDRIVFRIESESVVELKSITEYGENDLFLTRGLMMSKISKLKKGNHYIIETPTTVASVRGTVFLTEYNNRTTKVAVSEGKVKVEHISSEREKYTDAGKTVVVKDTIKSRKISAIEKLMLGKIEGIPVMENVNSIGSGKLREEGDKIQENDERIDKEIDKLTLNNIRSEYGRIDIVTLYNGKIYNGAILSRGKTIRMITTSGIISIDAKKVKQTKSR